ncbi:periostin-like [Mizuhopecten yessoensis]|uniref:Periostin n=1 Tax=Mizuhopecten yessoensis TaxID=6573 RepID=A0A210PGC3_MIZYE|nr:periostin-like [Mizuhopecten yessoensis]OWF35507.1 Periostin [Mizuhopecten yessoensis]
MEVLQFVVLFITCTLATSEQTTVLDVAAKNGATILRRLLNGTYLESLLLSEGNYTLFAPVDDGFDWLPPSVYDELNKNKTFVNFLFTFHVVKGQVESEKFKNDVTFATLHGATKVRMNIIGTTYTADGVDVTLPDLSASNGVVHMLQRAMYPIPTLSLLEYLTTTPTLSRIVEVIQHANLTEFFKGGPFTLFAPMNIAFGKLPDGFLEKLMLNKTGLVDLVKYHVLTDTLFSEGLYDNQRLTTANDKQLIVTVMEGNVVINGALIKGFDIIVNNGVIHVIDRVLIPPN